MQGAKQEPPGQGSVEEGGPDATADISPLLPPPPPPLPPGSRLPLPSMGHISSRGSEGGGAGATGAGSCGGGGGPAVADDEKRPPMPQPILIRCSLHFHRFLQGPGGCFSSIVQEEYRRRRGPGRHHI
ncbi:hypothetical protein XELAEV_18035756mg [Xenopus laevis]|uniref:Uncharacterized protein n=1 Tax=Xenopus laevis TaxID=8355 RepID=A0A974CGB8_XENLA|nr:hypothetical protein XELAEV_18035756mg [Xenopus laevis]